MNRTSREFAELPAGTFCTFRRELSSVRQTVGSDGSGPLKVLKFERRELTADDHPDDDDVPAAAAL